MKSFLALCAVVFGGVAFAGEVAQPAASAPCVDCAPQQTVVVLGAQPVRQYVFAPRTPKRTCVNGSCATVDTCANGNCGKPQYSVAEQSTETVRRRVFGGAVIRNNSRAVVKPVR